MKRFTIRNRWLAGLSCKRSPLTKRVGIEFLEPRRVLESTVVFNEVMYHPAGNNDQPEWVELYNQLAVDVDLSGWKLSDGVDFTFPKGTVIPGGGHVVVSSDPELLEQQARIGNVFGPFDGRLSNGGETIELRNNSGRLMNQLSYDDGHPWPVASDGSGASLAKAKPMRGSAQPENWTISDQVGGTPGFPNFPIFDPTVTQTVYVEFGSSWLISDAGIDLGEAWRMDDFDDNEWSSLNTPVVAGKDSIDLTESEPITTLFNTGFDEDGELLANGRRDPHWIQSDTGDRMRAMIPNDAWLPNNEESQWVGIRRSGNQGVDPGQYTFSTQIDLTEWNASTASIDVLVAVDDRLDDIQLNGNSTGINASGFDQFNGPFTIDTGFESGLNTLAFQFINGGDEPNPSGLRVELQGEAIPRQRGQRINDEPSTYYFRNTFQYLGNPNVEPTLLLETWIDDGAVFYLNGQEIHRQNMPDGPVGFETRAESEVTLATRSGPFELPADHLVPGENVLAVEVHQFSNDGDDAQFDAELTVVEEPLPPPPAPPKVAFNEMLAADGDAFWLELINLEDDPVDLGGFVISNPAQQAEYQLPTIELAANGLMRIEKSELGFQPNVGDHVFLYTPNRIAAIDGQVASDRLQGRSDDHDGRWLSAATPTPGADNLFEFHDEIVLNEIQYNARPTLAKPEIPATFKSNPLVPLNSSWLYNQAGQDLGSDWHATQYVAGSENWFSGQAPIGFETGRSADLITTMVDEPRSRDPFVTTYYFQTQFEFNGDLAEPGLQLQYAHLIDDGAVFYLNGAEIDRFNMPEGPIDSSVFAEDRINNASPIGPMTLPVDRLRVGTNVLSVEVHQERATDSDIFFDATLSLVETLAPAIPGTPFIESNEEWIELYNRSEQTVDLSGWQLTDGVQFEFPSGTSIAPNGYLVVTNNAANLQQIYPELTTIVGEFEGRLNNQSDHILLLDERGNPADEVTYYDGENWPASADGSGSTLELRDPDSNNMRAESWAASDETQATSWQHVSYRDDRRSFPGTNDPERWNELIIGLLSAGEILIDDVSVIEDPDGEAVQLIQNGTFDDGTDHFRLVGNHGGHGLSKIVPDPEDPNNPVLHIVATGFSEHMSNHVETTYVDNRELALFKDYEISYRVKWLSGSGQVNTRSYFNRMARTTVLDVPRAAGTPGAPNSVGRVNLGPTYVGLRHEPITPNPGEEVSVFVQADDSTGVDEMLLWYSSDGGDWQNAPMSRLSHGPYQGVVPAHDAGTVVQFYVEGKDGQGSSSTYPAAGRDSRALYIVDDGRDITTNQHSFRVVMTAEDAREQVVETNVMSNHRIGATIVTDGEVYYDVQTRIKGSGFGRGSNQRGYNFRFQPDRLFRGVHDLISIDRKDNQTGQGASHRELVHKHIGASAGNIPELYDDLIYIIPPDDSFTGPAQLQLARYDREFLESSYVDGSNGTRFEFELIYHITATVPSRDVEGLKVRPSAVLGIDFQDLGDDKEAYRWNFLIKNQRLRDDYSQIIELGKTLDLQGRNNGGELDLRSQAVMDVDAWLRTFAYISLGGINDTYNQGLPHNVQLFVRPEDQRVVPLPWDQDFTFHHAPTMPLLGTGSNLRNVLEIPNNRHHFYGHMVDIMSTSYNLEYLRPWISHYASFVRFDETAAIEKYIEDRSSFVMRRLPDVIDFSIDADGPIVVEDTVATLTGTGWVDVRDIRVAGSEHPLNVVWTGDTEWETILPVPTGTNEIVLEAINLQGELIGSGTFNVTSTITERPLEQFLRVSEVMFNPADPTANELALGYDNNDDFEYLELVNIGDVPLDLAGASLVVLEGEGVEFDFSTGTISELAAGERALVVEDSAAFQARYGDGLPVVGQWNGQLGNGGETITLRAGDQTIQQFAYDDAWYAVTDGGGESLVIVNATADLEKWNEKAGWSPSGIPGGSPGVATGRPGDANGDGIFDSNDLVAVLAAGEFEDGIEDNSTFEEGDWNGDGDFTTADLVAAFVLAGFEDDSVGAVRRNQLARAVDFLYSQRENERRR